MYFFPNVLADTNGSREPAFKLAEWGVLVFINSFFVAKFYISAFLFVVHIVYITNMFLSYPSPHNIFLSLCDA